MKITALFLGLVLLASTAFAQAKEVETKFTDYGFAVTLTADVTLVHKHVENAKDKPTPQQDTFTSAKGNYRIIVAAYDKPTTMSPAQLTSMLKLLGGDECGKISTDTQDGQPSASTLLTLKANDGTVTLVDVMLTAKGNRVFVVNYVRAFDADMGGVLLFVQFKML